MEVTINQEDFERRAKTSKPLLWIGIVSIIMLFAGLTSAYIVRQAEGNWLEFELPISMYVSTAIIILSSITLWYGQSSAKKGNYSAMKIGLFVTLGLGLGFVFSQFQVWSDLVAGGVFFTGAQANASGSFMYLLSGLHLAHLFGGIIALFVTATNASAGKYSNGNILGIELCSIYWHFLDILWIYLLLFLLFIR